MANKLDTKRVILSMQTNKQTKNNHQFQKMKFRNLLPSSPFIDGSFPTTHLVYIIKLANIVFPLQYQAQSPLLILQNIF